jgi:hypothetical protein
MEAIVIRNMKQLNAEMARHPEYTHKTKVLVRQKVEAGLKMGYEVTYRVW